MPKVMRALGIVCGAGHTYVTLYQAKAKLFKRNCDLAFHSCRPHRIVTMIDVTSLVSTLRGAMKRHGCKGKCDVCGWAAHVIASIWKHT